MGEIKEIKIGDSVMIPKMFNGKLMVSDFIGNKAECIYVDENKVLRNVTVNTSFLIPYEEPKPGKMHVTTGQK